MQTFPKLCKQTKGKKRKSPKNHSSLLSCRRKGKVCSPGSPSHKDSTVFAVIKQIYIMGQPTHTFKHVFNFFQLNSPIDLSDITDVNNVTNVFKDLED